MAQAAADTAASQPGRKIVRLMLLRHGESEWNQDGRFTGWTDIGLTERGRSQSERVGELLAQQGYRFDVCFSSRLRRATDTARIVLDSMGQTDLSVHENWRLNERHYGALQGLRWWQGVLRFGPVVVIRCKKSHDVPPPTLEAGDSRHPANDPMYSDVPRDQLPSGESILATRIRATPAWHNDIEPALRSGLDTLVVAHKNSIRAFLRLLSQRSNAGVSHEVIRTCVPIVLEFDEDLNIVRQLIGGREQPCRPLPA